MKKILLILSFTIVLIGCKNDEKTFDAGYDDGYATGYNTQCQIRPTMIYGHFDSEEYSRGYNTGKYDGAQACIVDRKNNNIR